MMEGGTLRQSMDQWDRWAWGRRGAGAEASWEGSQVSRWRECRCWQLEWKGTGADGTLQRDNHQDRVTG